MAMTTNGDEISKQIKKLSRKIKKVGSSLTTEAITKDAIIKSFLKDVLGYDYGNPTEVVPEFTADSGDRNGKKVDYAIHIDGKPQILIECKSYKEDLSKHVSQLAQYFVAAKKARVGILTNGEIYQFYADLDRDSGMDEKPFLTLDISKPNFDENVVLELKKLTKASFNIESMVGDAKERLEHLNKIKEILKEQFESPDEDFSNFFISKFDVKRRGKTVKAKFHPIIKEALGQFLKDKIEAHRKPKTAKTHNYTDGLNIIKGILSANGFDAQRIGEKKNKGYSAIYFDMRNNIFCRLYLDETREKCVVIRDETSEKTHRIEKVDDICGLSKELLKSAKRFN